jgi:hypothetical protein
VRVHGDSLNHAKAAIADERHGALVSANFDAEHGLRSGVEIGVRLDGDSALAEARRYVEHAIANADLTFAAQPKQREMNQRLAAAWCTRWPFEADVRVTASDRTWERAALAIVAVAAAGTAARRELPRSARLLPRPSFAACQPIQWADYFGLRCPRLARLGW